VAAGERGRVGAAGDPGDLGGGEGGHPALRVVAEHGAEVVEVVVAVVLAEKTTDIAGRRDVLDCGDRRGCLVL
jgi:hypothetical protein